MSYKSIHSIDLKQQQPTNRLRKEIVEEKMVRVLNYLHWDEGETVCTWSIKRSSFVSLRPHLKLQKIIWAIFI